jgi:DNA-binding GntR family transcriptional regulator
MRADIQAGNRTVAELQGLLQKELAAIYNASRDTVRKALRAIVSEFGENSIRDK